MEPERQVEDGTYPETRLRALGFDPSHLTREEQVELLEIYEACPDEALEQRSDGVEWW